MFSIVIGVAGGTMSGVDSKAHHAVRWDGNALIFESGTYTRPAAETGAWVERREVWSLEPDGRLRLVITIRGSSEGSRTATWLYRRT